MLPLLFMLTAPSPLIHSDLKLQCHLLASPPALGSSLIDWPPLGSFRICPTPQHLQFHSSLNLFAYLNTTSGFSLSWGERLWESVPRIWYREFYTENLLPWPFLSTLSSHGHHSHLEGVLGDKCPAHTYPALLITFSNSLWSRHQSWAYN